MGIVTWNSGRSQFRNLGRLTSITERSTRISSECSGYLSFKFPAAVSTDFTARIPEQHRHHHSQVSREPHNSNANKYIFYALLFLQSITFFVITLEYVQTLVIQNFYLQFIIPQNHPKPKTVISFLSSVNVA